jgi:hypothetical protein
VGLTQLGEARSESEEFFFTLKNPHNLPARRFALKNEGKSVAVHCDSLSGPSFVDICVCENRNANASTGSYLGRSYANDTGLDGQTVLTGSRYFAVREIEVFEIRD